MSDFPRFVRADANGVSEVNCGNLVERYVSHLEEKGLYEIQRSAGRSFLQKECGTDGFVDSSFSMRWRECAGRKVIFFNEMARVCRTKSQLCRSQSAAVFEVSVLFLVETREHHRGVQHVLLQQRGTDQEVT